MQSRGESRFPAIALLWCCAVTAVYLFVCIHTLLNPLNRGMEKMWAIPLVLVATTAILAHRFAPLSVARFWYPVALALTAGGIVIHTGNTIGVLISLLLIGASVGAGELTFRLLRIPDTGMPAFERLILVTTTGIAILGVVAIALAAFNLLILPLAAAILGASVWFSIRPMRALFDRSQPVPDDEDRVPELPVLRIFGGYLVLLNLIWAVAPEVQFDALNYHLTVPATWARAGGLTDLLFVHSYLAGLIESFYVFGFVFDSRVAVEMVPFWVALLAAGCVFVLAQRLAGRRCAAWAALLFYSTPLVMWASSTTDVDLAIGAFVAATAICLIRWRESRSAAWFYAAAILMGCGIGAKPTLLMIGPAVAILCIHFLFTDTTLSLGARIRTIVIATMLVAALSSHWYIVRARFTGNPVYPVTNSYFPTHRLVYGKGTFGGDFRIPFTPASIAAFPFAFTYDTKSYSESGVTSGGVGPWLLLAIPLVPLAFKRGSTTMRLVGGLALSYVALWTIAFSYARYYLPVLPLIVPLAAAFVMYACRSRTRVVIPIFAVVFAAQALSAPVQYWILSERFPIRYALGLESDEMFLERLLPGMSAVAYLNANAQAGERAVGIGFERTRYYLAIPFESWRGIPELRPVSRIDNPTELAAALRARGYDWLVIDSREPHNGERYLRKAFRERYGDLQFEGNDHLVYRLRP